MTPFNRVVALPEALATFLKTDEKLTFTELQSLLYDRLYRSGAVRHLDGSRAHRRRARDRQASKRRNSSTSNRRRRSAAR